MSVNRDELLEAIEAVKKPLAAAVANARMGRVRMARRVRNEDEALLDDPIEDDQMEEATEEVAEVGDTVVIEPSTEPITGEIVEVVEEPAEEVAEVVEEEPVTNHRRYRRIRNARIVRNADGSRSVVVPVDEKRVTNLRRYKTRTVTRNSGIAIDPTYAKTIATPDAASWAATVNKARKYDEMLLNASIEQSIDDALKKALNKSGVSNSSKSCKNSRTQVVRFSKYRGVRNEDGSVAIEVNLGDAEEVPPTIAEVTAIPESSDVPESDVAIEVNGYEVPLDNSRMPRRSATRAVANNACAYTDNGVLEVPTTFTPKR